MLESLLKRYRGTSRVAPCARGVYAMANMECGAAGNFGKECSSPSDPSECVYNDDDGE